MNQKNAMSAEDNKATLLRLFSELRKGNTSAIDEVCSPNFAFHSPNFPNWPRGLAGARAIATQAPSLFSDSQSTIDDVFAAEDKVVVRWSISGKYIGEPKPGFPNPGERFAMGAVAIYRFVDGKIVDDGAYRLPARRRTALGAES
jgi:ketosteroid isomerase-like protein